MINRKPMLLCCCLLAILGHSALAQAPSTRSIGVRVVDPFGHAVEGVQVMRSVWTEQKDFNRTEDFTTSDDGFATVTLPDSMSMLRLWVKKQGFVTLFANWSPSAVNDVPKEMVVSIPEGSKIGGVVVDEDGKPIEGVKVEVRLAAGGLPLNSKTPFRYSEGLATYGRALMTDARGRFSLVNAPPGEDVKLSLRLTHKDFVSDVYYDELARKQGISTKSLRDQSARIVMPKGESVHGTVTSLDGRPITGARISWSREDRWMVGDNLIATTDADGRYELPSMENGKLYLAVAGRVGRPLIKELEISNGMPPVDLQLDPGSELRIEFVDPQDKPIPDVHVMVQDWGNITSGIIAGKLPLFNGLTPEYSDEQGIFLWKSAPDDAVKLWVKKKGFGGREIEVAASDGSHRVMLRRAVVISGNVVDDVTGAPIQDVMMIPVTHYPSRPDDPIVQRSQIRFLADGRYSRTATGWQSGQELMLQFEKTGYRPKRLGPFNAESGRVIQEVRLQRAAPLAGRVIDETGRPVSGANVSFTTKDTSLIVDDWTYRRDGLSRQTDEKGRFEFPATLHPPVVIATTEDGYAEVALELDQQVGDLQLSPWARVTGRLVRSGKPVAGERIYLRPIRMLGGDHPHVQDSFTTLTDADGHFELNRVPPVPSTLHGYVSVWRDTRLTSAKHVPLDLEPGKTADVVLGEGVTVRGRVRPMGEIASTLEMNYCLNYLLKRASGITPPPAIAKTGLDARGGFTFDLTSSSEGQGFLSTLHHHFVRLQPDGTFEISGVDEGDYQFAISIYEPPQGCLIDPVGRKVVDFHVGPDAVTRGDFDLGLIEVEVKLGPRPGDPFPNFRYEGLEPGEEHQVSAHRGRFLLVDFWATWCAPCVAKLPELKAIARGLDPDRAAILSVCLDEQVEEARRFIAKREMDWPQALLGNRDNPVVRQQLGISSVPIYYVIDPEGRLVDRSFELAEAVAALRSAMGTD